MEDFGPYSYMNRRRPMYHHQYYRPKIMGQDIHINQKHNKNIEPKPLITKEIKKEEPDGNKFFEILGIKFYFDDLLIIALLFFLYKEKADDPWLFISLVLLLIT